SNPIDQPVIVNYHTADGTARVADGDYVPTSGTLTLPAKTSSGTIAVPVYGDFKREADEVFVVDLENPVNASIADGVGLGTIVNDDPVPALRIQNASVPEGNSGVTSAVFNVTLSNPTDQTVTVGYATADSTARVSNNDYQSTSGTLTLPAEAV